jgi:hypothetical protein
MLAGFHLPVRRRSRSENRREVNGRSLPVSHIGQTILQNAAIILPVAGAFASSHPFADTVYVRRHGRPPGRFQLQRETLQSAIGTPSHASRLPRQGISRCTGLAQPSSDLVRPIEEAKGRRLVLRLVPKPAALTATQAVDAVYEFSLSELGGAVNDDAQRRLAHAVIAMSRRRRALRRIGGPCIQCRCWVLIDDWKRTPRRSPHLDGSTQRSAPR